MLNNKGSTVLFFNRLGSRQGGRKSQGILLSVLCEGLKHFLLCQIKTALLLHTEMDTWAKAGLAKRAWTLLVLA